MFAQLVDNELNDLADYKNTLQAVLGYLAPVLYDIFCILIISFCFASILASPNGWVQRLADTRPSYFAAAPACS